MNPLPAKVFLYDTTLRDGTQGEGVSFSVDDKLMVASRLDEFGIDYIEGGWPGSNPKDIEFFRRGARLPLRRARLAAFGSTRRPGIRPEEDLNLQALLAAETPVATIFGKSWDFHVTRALRTTPDENLRMIEESVAFLRAAGREVIYDAEHFFDGFKANRSYALATLEAACRGGAQVIVLCDTNGGTLPHEIGEMVRQTREHLGPGGPPLGIHCHNDSGVAVANSLAAVLAGAVHVQGTINGYGERCGNADLVQIVPNLQLKLGVTCVPPEQLASLTQLARYVAELANLPPDPRQPFVGATNFAHKGGIHVSAVLRHPETYEHIPPEAVGNERRVLVSELAGASNVRYKAAEYGIGLPPDSPHFRQVVEEVKALEHQGYTFEAAEGSFELMLRRAAGQLRPAFHLLGLRVVIEKGSDGRPGPCEATVKLRVGEEVVHTAADGDGPVHALDRALRKALRGAYPAVDRIRLTDYKVRVINEKAGTAARVRVLIHSTDGEARWGTVGVSENIIEASWKALVDSIEYGLLRVHGVAQERGEGARDGAYHVREDLG